MKNSQFWAIFEDFWALWSPGGTQYPSPDTLWMTILSLGHSIMCVPKRNLIQCMGDMALMAIMCEKWPIFMWFLMIFWTFGVQMGPISFTRRPMNDYFIFGTLNPVFTNEKFDSMYGWYGSNAQNMWKIANFGRFLKIFGPFGAQVGPNILLQTPYEWQFYLWDTQSCVYQREIWFNVWVIWL